MDGGMIQAPRSDCQMTRVGGGFGSLDIWGKMKLGGRAPWRIA